MFISKHSCSFLFLYLITSFLWFSPSPLPSKPYPNYPGKRVDPEIKMLPLPDVRQAWDYSCGASALQSILVYFGKCWDREDQICKLVKVDPEWGTEPIDIQKGAVEYGLKATIKENLSLADLEKYYKKGIPVIVAYQAWKDEENKKPWAEDWIDGHYSIVIGIDENNVYLEDPSLIGELGYIPREEFLRRWHDIDRQNRKLIHLGIIIESSKPPFDVGRFARID
ncbi:C39 family peptidase [Candidatus Riflebacteria bacterium]